MPRRTWARVGRTGTVLAGGAALVVALLLAWSARAGDPDLARFLLQAGKEALAKGNAADAVTKLEKARAEDPALSEVAYWMGAALEARGDVPGAVREYREFLRAIAAPGAAAASKDAAALQKKAQARVDVLDAARREVERAHEAFAAPAIELARRVAKDDPGLAERALRLVLAVQPDHAAARELLGSPDLASGSAGTISAALRGLPKVWDLVATHGLGKSDGWTYGEGRMDVKLQKGAMTRTPDGYDTGPTYAMEAEVVRNEVPMAGRVSVVGLTFGWGPDDGLTLLFVNNDLELGTFGKRGKMVLEKASVAPWRAAQRRTLAVRVEGRRVRGYVDGRVVLTKEFDADKPLGGDVGVVFENVDVTVHRLVVAQPEGGGR